MDKIKFRPGPVGALMDEYERAMNKLLELSSTFTQEEFVKIVDEETDDEDCRSVQTILNHVFQAGYGYSNYIRKKFDNPVISNPAKIENIEDNYHSQMQMFQYMLDTMADKYEFTSKVLGDNIIETRWGAIIDVDMLLEHAIVHLLRHRRQLEKFKQLYFS